MAADFYENVFPNSVIASLMHGVQGRLWQTCFERSCCPTPFPTYKWEAVVQVAVPLVGDPRLIYRYPKREPNLKLLTLMMTDVVLRWQDGSFSFMGALYDRVKKILWRHPLTCWPSVCTSGVWYVDTEHSDETAFRRRLKMGSTRIFRD